MIPLRISALSTLGKCAGAAALNTATERESGAAADTGTAVGRMVELWHKQGETPTALDAAVRQTEAEIASHPKANLQDAAAWASGYAADSRNAGVVDAKSLEAEVRLQLGPFELVGHLDQIRNVNGAESVWDVKSGQGARLSACSCGALDKTAVGGREMTRAYAWQVSAYALAASETFKRTILPGGVIRIRAYGWNSRCRWDKADMSTAPAFHYMPWDLDACREQMDSVLHLLELLQSGRVLCTPGAHCLWCPGEAPNLCGDRIADAFEGSDA
jgi:hypothetical protein